jgi:hypothetical protein
MNEIFKPVTKEEQESVSSLPPGYKEIQETVVTGENKFPDLTEEQIQEVVRRVQAALLKQAKRSRRTGIQRPPEDTP